MDMKVKRDNKENAIPSSNVSFPSFYLSEKIPDFLLNKDVGDVCNLMIKVKIMSKGINESTKEKRTNLNCDILEINNSKEYKDDNLSKRIAKLNNRK